MSTIAGHSFDFDGVCRRLTRRNDVEVTCGMTKRQLRTIVYEFRSLNTSGVGEYNIAHAAHCTQSEWIEACDMVEAEDKAFDEALKQVCRA
jgi:hypothetical protein